MLFIGLYSLSAQVITPLTGQLEGQVRDSLLNRVLPTATVSVYADSTSQLLGYTLTDRTGMFKISGLPPKQTLKLVVSFVGYTQIQHSFFLQESEVLNFGVLKMFAKENMLEEVEITAVLPVRMNGDTLEFNADAFRLEPNAVAEDLLKKLPGVVVWGDGMITVNGKEIDALLVNGKPFFGGQSKIATQNIAKDAIKKVQVYKKNLLANAVDSAMEVNLVLKDPNAIGFFGKANAGAGITNRHDLMANFNAFSATNQISGIIGSNNVNKESKDIEVLIKNSSFKGNKLQNEYETDFSKVGDIRSRKAGFFAEHFLKPDLANQNYNKIKVDYLRNLVDLDLQRRLDAITTISALEDQRRKSIDETTSNKKGHVANGNFSNMIGHFTISLSAKVEIEEDLRQTNLFDSVMKNDYDLVSLRRQSKDFMGDRKLSNLNLSLAHQKNQDGNILIPGDWKIDYGLKVLDEDETSRNKLDFRIFNQSSQQNFDRLSLYRNRAVEHRFVGRYGNLLKSILRRQIYNSKFEIVGDLVLGNRKISDSVTNIFESLLLSDKNLSYNRQEDYTNLQGGFVWTYNKINQLSGRFNTTRNLSIDLRQQLFSVKNRSDRSFQNLSRQYSRILPSISYSSIHLKDRKFQNVFNADLLSTYNYPEIEDLVPIIDTLQVFDVNLGNRNLNPSNNRELRLSFTHRKLKANALVYSLHLKVAEIVDPIGVASILDSAGRSSYYLDNFNKSHLLEFGYRASQSFKFKTDQLQIKTDANINHSSIPNTLMLPNQNSFTNTTQNINLRINGDLYYIFNEIAEASINYSFLHSKVTQEASHATLSSQSHKVRAAVIRKFGSKWVCGIDAAHSRVLFLGMPTSFNIVNLNLSKRFLKQENLELTLSGSDIFNQNQRINFSNTVNTSMQERQNMLGRHYLLSLAYYPRKFGRK